MQEQARQSAGRRLGFVEGLRGIAAFYVVLQHTCTLIDPYFGMQRPNAEPAWLATAMAPLWYGHLAVAAFIVISGYCLQLSLYSRGDGRIDDMKRFFRRRCLRILPPYYACLGLSLVVVWLVTQHQKGMPWIQYLPVTWENTLAHVFMIHNLNPAWMYKINGVLWSISIEFQLYFLFPLLVLLLWRWGRLALMAPATLVALALLLFYPPASKLYVWYIPLFVLGMGAAQIGFDPRMKNRGNCRAWLTIAGFFAVLTILSISWTKNIAIRDSLGGIAISALLVAGAVRPHAKTFRFLGSGLLIWLGAFSYSLYLMHHPILQVLYVARPEAVQSLPQKFLYLILCLPIILALCYVFFWFFERPFLKDRQRRFAEVGRPAAAEA